MLDALHKLLNDSGRHVEVLMDKEQEFKRRTLKTMKECDAHVSDLTRKLKV